jgi:NAD(P)-dependent dehydrogenase (short-subunit alcohol dehydrogenase family)
MKKIALVTGGTRGIGFGIAQALARQGCDLALCGIRSQDSVAQAIEQLQSLGSEVIYLSANIADRDARHDLVEAVKKRFGRLNVLINNAGIGPRVRGDVLDATEESFDEVLGTNLRGPFFLTQTVAKWMLQQRNDDGDFWGCIVNISSISADVASTNRAEYCISKAGVAMATKVWAARLGEFGIPVYEVRPGIIKTDMTSGVADKYEQLLKTGVAVQARWGTADDVGRAVAALVRGDFPYSSGSVFLVDGGLSVQRL